MAPPITCYCGSCEKCKHRAYMRAWYRRPGNAQRQRDTAIASRARRIEDVRAYDKARERTTDPIKVKARTAVMHALARGQLERGSCVVGVNCRGRLEAHHEDYNRPLDVVWLCQKHHAERHRRRQLAVLCRSGGKAPPNPQEPSDPSCLPAAAGHGARDFDRQGLALPWRGDGWKEGLRRDEEPARRGADSDASEGHEDRPTEASVGVCCARQDREEARKVVLRGGDAA